jgi:hypothetical protein
MLHVSLHTALTLLDSLTAYFYMLGCYIVTHCYATLMRRNMCCLVTVVKHVSMEIIFCLSLGGVFCWVHPEVIARTPTQLSSVQLSEVT